MGLISDFDIDLEIEQSDIDVANEIDIDIGDINNIFDVTNNNDEKASQVKINETRYCKPKLFRNVSEKNVKYDNAEKFINELKDDIFAGNRIFAIISGKFVFGDIIECLVFSTKKTFKNITISTLSMSIENVYSFENVVKSKRVENFDLLVSIYFYAHNRATVYEAYKVLDVENKFQLAVGGVHTKIILIEMDDGQKIVIHGSANLRSSSSIEQIMIETNAELYDFNYEFHKMIIDKYATIKKPVRDRLLWETITK